MLKPIRKMSNSLRSNSAIFLLNTKFQNSSTFTNFFRLPHHGYTTSHPGTQTFPRTKHLPLKRNHPAWPTRGSPRGNSGLRNYERVPPRKIFHVSKQEGCRAVPGLCNCERVPPRNVFTFPNNRDAGQYPAFAHFERPPLAKRY